MEKTETFLDPKQTSDVLVFINEENVYEDNSLQDNFKKFLKMRKDLRKLTKKEDTSENVCIKLSTRVITNKMELLRKKFIDQAMGYIGVPYGKRYLKEDNPLYNSPIFLDCCGLVRQCVNDLAEDFGFMLG